MPDDLYFERKEHMWAKIEGNRVQVGLDAFGVQATGGNTQYVKLKPAGAKVKKLKPFGSIEAGKYIGPLRAPVGVYCGGRPEGILFRDLKKRELSEEHKRLMNDLIEEHVLGRTTAKKLIDANNRYRNGDKSALAEIASHLSSLADFYRKHIEKEDKLFFPAARKYFSEQEDQAMLDEFWEFDRKMIHEKYTSVVEAFEN